jgi:hypothetical protein
MATFTINPDQSLHFSECYSQGTILRTGYFIKTDTKTDTKTKTKTKTEISHGVAIYFDINTKNCELKLFN